MHLIWPMQCPRGVHKTHEPSDGPTEGLGFENHNISGQCINNESVVDHLSSSSESDSDTCGVFIPAHSNAVDSLPGLSVGLYHNKVPAFPRTTYSRCRDVFVQAGC